MRNILTAMVAFAAITAGTISANAQMRGNSSIRGILGFSSGALNIGADYEMKHSNLLGWGGYLLFAGDEKKTGVPEVLAVGVFAPIHFVNDDMVNVYIAPGFGFAKIDNGTEDETTVGPTVKLGAEFKVAPTVKVGLQHMIISNWLSDKVASQVSYTNAAATFSF